MSGISRPMNRARLRFAATALLNFGAPAMAMAPLAALLGAAPAHAAGQTEEQELAALLAPTFPDAAAKIAERDRLIAAKQAAAAIPVARELTLRVLASPLPALTRGKSAHFLSQTLLKANQFEEAFGWSLHAAGLIDGQAKVPSAATLVSDRAAAAKLVASLTITDQAQFQTFFELQAASVIAGAARRPDLAAIVIDRVADMAPVLLPGSSAAISIVSRAGMTDVDLGLGSEAETRLTKALELSQTAWGEADPRTRLALSNLSLALLFQGRDDEAVTLARRAHDGVKDGPPSQERLRTTLNFGRVLADLERFDEAAPLASEALTLAGQKPTIDLLNAHLLSGRVFEGRRQPNAALENFEMAIVLAAAAKGSFAWRMRPSLLMAESLIEADRWQKAQQYMLGSAILLWSEDTGQDADKMTSNGQTWTRRLASLSAQFNRGASNEDIALFDELMLRFSIRYEEEPGAYLDRARRLKDTINAQTDRTGFLPRQELAARRAALAARRRNTLFADYVWAGRDTLSLKDKAVPLRGEAFAALQRAGSSNASQAIAQLAARTLSAAISPELGELARRRETLVARWRELDQARVMAIGAAPPPKAMLDETVRVEAELAGIDRKLQQAAPQFFSYIRPAPLTEAQAAALFSPQEAGLLIVPTEAGTHLMLVTDKGVKWFHSDWDERKVTETVRRLLWFSGAGVEVSAEEAATWADEVPGEQSFDRTTAHALWRQLIMPLQAELTGRKTLYIAADGALSSLPFAVLVSELPGDADDDPAALRGTHWLADDIALVQLPSLQSLALLRSAERQTVGSGFSGWGDPALLGQATVRGGGRSAGGGVAMTRVFGAARTASGAGLADLGELRRLARLPGTASELTAMAKALSAPGSSLHLDKAATETALKRADLSDAGIIAFATHGITAGEIDGAIEPGLVMSPPDQAGAEDDGYLAASEVAQLKLAADWVILSACNTAAGDGSAGAPGLSGLARAFFYAGARNLLVSHWPVRDDVAAKLTVRTIEIARDNPDLSRAEAFQRAMREVRMNPAQDGSATLAHPNAWAPFTLIGDGGRP